MTGRAGGRPRKIRPEDLPAVAEVYITAPLHREIITVARAFAVDRTTAWRRISDAKAAGLIPEGARGFGEHQPVRVRASNSSEKWNLCRLCVVAWPCQIVRETQEGQELRDGHHDATAQSKGGDFAPLGGGVGGVAADPEQTTGLGDGDRCAAGDVAEVHHGSLPRPSVRGIG